MSPVLSIHTAKGASGEANAVSRPVDVKDGLSNTAVFVESAGRSNYSYYGSTSTGSFITGGGPQQPDASREPISGRTHPP